MLYIVRQVRLDEAKKARLVEAAIDEFAERGIEYASYNKIIERSGLSKGTVYYYFDNKDSLLLMVMDEICERFSGAIGNLELPDTKEAFWATDSEYNSRAIRFFLENPRIWRVLFWISQDAPNMEEQFYLMHEKAMRFMDELLAKGREIGAVRNDIPLDTVQRLVHSMGKVLSASMLGRCETGGILDKSGGEIETFMALMHDLGKRILTPEEDFACLHRF